MTMKRSTLYTLLFLAAVAILSIDAQAAARRPVVNVNTASEAEIAFLPGIGPKTAAAIYAYAEAGTPPTVGPVDNRCDHRCHFKTVDDLLFKVKGIGPAKLAALRPYVVVTGPTTATAKIRVPRAAKRAK